MSVEEILTQCRPAVGKNWLYLTAGLMWTAVGVMLMSRAVSWLIPLGLPGALPYVLGGLLACLALYFLSFSKLARNNAGRINSLQGDKSCIFAFQAWRSYLVILFMILLGITLRHYPAFPRSLLTIVYTSVGGALFLASLKYYGQLWNDRENAKDPNA